MFDELELIDVIGAVLLLFLVASVSVIVVTAPEVADPPPPPESNWTLERVNDTHMVVRHEGGEFVQTDNLTVIVEEYPRPTNWRGNASDGRVGEGGFASIEASDGQDIALYWTGSGTVRRQVLVEEKA